jgi:hypothetical protein
VPINPLEPPTPGKNGTARKKLLQKIDEESPEHGENELAASIQHPEENDGPE